MPRIGISSVEGRRPRGPRSRSKDLQGHLTPDWALIRKSFDGVHLSLWGYLNTMHVTVTSEAGTSRLWSWDGEQCFWLSRPDSRTITDVPNPRPT
jgi:hypothetical protein